jgi:hypothetical protein
MRLSPISDTGNPFQINDLDDLTARLSPRPDAFRRAFDSRPTAFTAGSRK